MKKEFLVASIFAALAAVAAEVTTSNEMGFVPVTNDMAKGSGMFLVTAPFGDYTEGAVRVADVIQTANLNTGDELFIPNGEGYDNWILKSDKTWEAAQKVTLTAKGAKVESGTAATIATVARGSAFWVKTTASQVNLFGNAEKTAKDVTAAGGTNALKWTLVGASLATSDIEIQSIAGATKGDTLVLANGNQYIYAKNGTWVSSKDFKSTTDKIPAGVGFWIATKSGITITGK